eukprot:1150195-Pelagomonas_calceolata.AAC.1
MQRCSKAIQTSRIGTAYNVLLLGEVRRAVCELASLLWLLGRADGWEIEEGADWHPDWHPYCLDWDTGREGLGVVDGSGGPTRKFDMKPCNSFYPSAVAQENSGGGPLKVLSPTSRPSLTAPKCMPTNSP